MNLENIIFFCGMGLFALWFIIACVKDQYSTEEKIRTVIAIVVALLIFVVGSIVITYLACKVLLLIFILIILCLVL